MNFEDSAEEREFRNLIRSWLSVNNPGPFPAEINDDEHRLLSDEWHRRLYRGGWMGLTWPVEFGGRGLEPIYEAILNDEVGSAAAPPVPLIGYLGRGILLFGDQQQKLRYLPSLLSGRERWCQGFSEPNAGSDLASLETRAIVNHAGYRLSGQKLWTSSARWADYCLVLARTDAAAPKHAGISALIVDMHSPGVTVRPITHIAGDRHFAEVFFDDVLVPSNALVGLPGQGWALAITTLAYERGPADIGYLSRYRRLFNLLQLEISRRNLELGEVTLMALGHAHVTLESVRLLVLRSLAGGH